MDSSRKVVTFLLTVAMAVAPLQGSMAKGGEMSGADPHADHHTNGSDLPDATPHRCSHRNHDTHSGVINESPGSGDDETLQTVSSTPGCNCGDGYCSCCGKVSVPVLPSIYTTVSIWPQSELIQTFALFTGTFVLVKTRPPTVNYSI